MNFKITLKVYLLLCFVLITSSKIIADTKWKQYYSVQVKAYPEYESDKAFGLYEMLKAKNYLVYYCKKKIKNQWWIRIKIGYFLDKGKAKKTGELIKQKEGLDFFVTNANILIDEYEDQFKVITTPGGIWKQLQSELEELISFYPNLHHAGILEETKAIVSPTGTDILFFYNHKIVTLNLSTKRSRILVKDGTTDKYDDPSKYYGDKKNVIRSNHDPVVKFELIEPSPKWSPDGKYIAYMDCQHWEFRTNLWLINSDGSNDTCLVKLTGSGEEQVKAFEWHPTKNEIFYLQGYAFGPPSGGNLYITDVNGNKSLAVQTESNDRLKIFNFKIETDGIYFTVAQFDANDIIPLRDRLHIKLSFSQIYQGAIITPKMLGLL